MAAKTSKLPFEQLPNLPPPIIPIVELRAEPIRWDLVQREDVEVADRRYLGQYYVDQSCQTNDSELGEVKQVAQVLDELSKSVSSLRKDLSFAQSVMKAEYESKILQRAIELHHAAGTKLSEVEKEHKEKLDNVRESYRILLNNAVKRICGEYKAYYEELLSGKSDRLDVVIKNLKERVIELETMNQEQEENIVSLKGRVKELEAERDNETTEPVFRTLSPPTPPPPTGISYEEADELRNTIDELRDEVTQTRLNLGKVETANSKLTQQVKELSKSLEDEQRRVKQLKKDLEVTKSKAKEDKANAEMKAQQHLKALEQEMSGKMNQMREEAQRKADREAEMLKMRDQAREQQELARQKALEEELARERDLRANAAKPADNKGLLAELEKLRKVEAFQKKEIDRLQSEVDNAGKTWELKLAIMQKNFHAFKDEAFVRKTLQRQAAQLHHATVSYAIDGGPSMSSNHIQPLKPRVLPKFKGDRPDHDIYTFSPHKPLPEVFESDEEVSAVPEPPTPSPRHMGSQRGSRKPPGTPQDHQTHSHHIIFQ